MEPNSSPKFFLSLSFIHKYQGYSRKLVGQLDQLTQKYFETDLVVYKNAKQILNGVIGKLEIVLSFGPCEFEWMNYVHKAILSFNEATDNYEDIMHEIDQMEKSRQ